MQFISSHPMGLVIYAPETLCVKVYCNQFFRPLLLIRIHRDKFLTYNTQTAIAGADGPTGGAVAAMLH
jgi:hypothetical protein